jgi:hypothetical protein
MKNRQQQLSEKADQEVLDQRRAACGSDARTQRIEKLFDLAWIKAIETTIGLSRYADDRGRQRKNSGSDRPASLMRLRP